ncbi:MAG TPA: hypothetical protein VN682_15075, partial [Terriglobales bacterium]|nr:hypothetical protein [Terriglobales bacterium]
NYSGQACHGINIFVTAREFLDSPEMGLEIATALHTLYPEQFHIEKMGEIVANQTIMNSLVHSEDPRRIALDWQDELQKFQQARERYLIYK